MNILPVLLLGAMLLASPAQAGEDWCSQKRLEAVAALSVFHTYYWSQDQVVAQNARGRLDILAKRNTNYAAMMDAWDRWQSMWATVGGDNVVYDLARQDYQDAYHAWMDYLLAGVAGEGC